MTTIRNIDKPTARAYDKLENTKLPLRKREKILPHINPTACPPTKFLALATILFGIAKTMKVDAPNELTIIGLS